MGVSTKNKNKKAFWPYYILIGICGIIVVGILIGIVQVILFLHLLSQSNLQAEKANEAKKLMAPVESYARSHDWRSVRTLNYPFGGDNTVPGYNEVFLANQTQNEVTKSMLMYLGSEGYQMNTQPSSSLSVDPSDSNLQGTSVSGNEVDVTISHIGYAEEDGSVTKVPTGITAVTVYFAYNGYVRQLQKEAPPSNVGCVGSGCP